MEKNRPAHEIRFVAVKAVIWANPDVRSPRSFHTTSKTCPGHSGYPGDIKP